MNDLPGQLDYGQYGDEDRFNHFCSRNCRFFSECPGKGGFCSFVERREILPGQENAAAAVSLDNNAGKRTSSKSDSKGILFWCFPAGKGAVQPWRRKLWDYKK